MKQFFASLNGFDKGIRKPGAACQLRASVADPGELLLEVYGPIGASIFEEGITTQEVADALKGEETRVTVRLNSPGGSAMDGVAIYNLLKNSGKAVRVIVDGIAASAASIIAMAGDTIEMGAGTMLMIHPAMMLAMGNSVDMREAADILEKATGNMADIYAARTGLNREDLLQMMYAETWMNPQEALDKGFATKMHEGKPMQGAAHPRAMAADYNLAALYEKTPEDLKVFEEPEPVKETPVANAAKRALELY